MRASIESNGDAKFGNIYSNGSLVTSDRKKKTGVKKLSGTFLEKVRDSAVYRYRLKQDMIPEKNAKNLKGKSVGTKNESVGLMYDEAPEEIRTLADQRWQAKQNRDWTEADRLRAEVAALGWVIKDRKDGYDLARK